MKRGGVIDMLISHITFWC